MSRLDPGFVLSTSYEYRQSTLPGIADELAPLATLYQQTTTLLSSVRESSVPPTNEPSLDHELKTFQMSLACEAGVILDDHFDD